MSFRFCFSGEPEFFWRTRIQVGIVISPILKVNKLGFQCNVLGSTGDRHILTFDTEVGSRALERTHHTICDKGKLCWLDISLEFCA